MEYAICQLEQEENRLKSLKRVMPEHEIRDQKIEVKLTDIQKAILVIKSSESLINIGKIEALTSLKK